MHNRLRNSAPGSTISLPHTSISPKVAQVLVGSAAGSSHSHVVQHCVPKSFCSRSDVQSPVSTHAAHNMLSIRSYNNFDKLCKKFHLNQNEKSNINVKEIGASLLCENFETLVYIVYRKLEDCDTGHEGAVVADTAL